MTYTMCTTHATVPTSRLWPASTPSAGNRNLNTALLRMDELSVSLGQRHNSPSQSFEHLAGDD